MKRPRILLADDHRMIAQALKKMLTPECDVVGIVEDGLALIEAAPKLEPDVIVADISMPRMDGLKALAELKKNDPNVKVVFLTMYQEPALVRAVLDAGGLGFVSKCSAPNELIAAIRAALAGKIYLATELASSATDEILSDSSGRSFRYSPKTTRVSANTKKER